MKLLNLLSILCLAMLISCEAEFGSLGSSDAAANATQGSYTNMLVIGDFMYVINKEKLQTYSLQQADNPTLLDGQEVGFNIESLLHHKGSLFIGSAQAMFIYEIDDKGIPNRTSITDYESLGNDFCMNDPIAVNDGNAFASLSSRSVGECGRFDMNEIRVYDITNLEDPRLMQTVAMDSPRGIALDGDILFVCEAEIGLKVLDVSNPDNPVQIYHFAGFKAFDVIANDGLLVVVGPEKIYEYDYSDIHNMKYLSELDI